MHEALACLGEDDRELVRLTSWEGLSTADAARVLGIGAGAARVRLHRARGRLREQPALREPAGGEEPAREPAPARG